MSVVDADITPFIDHEPAGTSEYFLIFPHVIVITQAP